jgi:hypothetical protein
MEDLLVTLATGVFFIIIGIGIAVTLMIAGRNFDD